ncbi:MAG: cell surface protein, partial [Isosphaeraceae bacterium]
MTGLPFPRATAPGLILALALCGLAEVPASAADTPPKPTTAPAPAPPPTEGVVKLEVFPADVNLATVRDRQSVVAQATYADGITRDVTANASMTLANPALVKRDGSTFYPAAEGPTNLAVTFAGKTVNVPVKVAQPALDPPISFRLDVMPVFMKAGCNTGSCHGAARGKDGFRISLFGFDPEGDHYRLTREMSGRRINLAVPAESTLIEKGLGTVPHSGGKRFEADSELCQTLIRWIEAGVPNDDVSKLPKVVGV